MAAAAFTFLALSGGAATAATVGLLEAPSCDNPGGTACSADVRGSAGTYWVAMAQQGVTRVVIDPSGRVSVTTHIGSVRADDVLVDPDGLLLVRDADTGVIARVDPQDGRTVSARVNRAALPSAGQMVLQPDGGAIWLAVPTRSDALSIARVDLTDGATVGMNVGGVSAPAGIAFSTGGSRLFVGTVGRVAELDPQTGAVVRSVALGSPGQSISPLSYDPGGTLYADCGADICSVATGGDDAATLAVGRTVRNVAPDAIAADGHGHVWGATCGNSGPLCRIDVGTVDVVHLAWDTQGGQPSGMAPVSGAGSAPFAVQPALARWLRGPRDVSFAPGDVARSAAVTAGMMLLVAFPAQLFNSTLQAHYDEVAGWFTLARRRRRAAHERTAAQRPASLATVAAVMAGGSVLTALLDPGFGLNRTTVEAVLGALLALSVTTFIYTGVGALMTRRITRSWGGFRVYRVGIAIAVFCVALSRLTHAQPGYMYGVLLAYGLAAPYPYTRAHRGRITAVGFTAVLATSLAVWLAWSPVRDAATGGGFLAVVASTAMAAIFLGGMTSLVFSLLPLRFLDGEHLWSWQRAAWLVLFGVGTFLFVHVVLHAAATSTSPGRSLAVAVALFCGFGLASCIFWAYFRFRPPHPVRTPATG